MRRFALLTALTLLLALPHATAAQPQLVVEPDSLFFDGRGGTPDSVMLVNTGSDSLRIDSLRFTDNSPAWYLELALPDTTYRYLDYLAGRLVREGGFPYAVIVSRDTSVIQFNDYDGCPVCKKSNLMSHHVRDTLIVYASDASRSPARVPITISDTELPVDKPDAPVGFSVEAYPNPVRSRATITVRAERAGAYEAAVYDVWGRQVVRRSKRLAAGASWRFRWPNDDANAPSSGLYLLRVETGTQTLTKAITLTQ